MISTRRAALGTLVGLGAGLGLTKTASAALHGADLIPALYAERCRAAALANEAAEAEEADALMDRVIACDTAACATTATTMAGAAASIEWAHAELVEHYLDADGYPGERLILSLIDGALGVLRGVGA